jgi:hypothetical protein
MSAKTLQELFEETKCDTYDGDAHIYFIAATKVEKGDTMYSARYEESLVPINIIPPKEAYLFAHDQTFHLPWLENICADKKQWPLLSCSVPVNYRLSGSLDSHDGSHIFVSECKAITQLMASNMHDHFTTYKQDSCYDVHPYISTCPYEKLDDTKLIYHPNAEIEYGTEEHVRSARSHKFLTAEYNRRISSVKKI